MRHHLPKRIALLALVAVTGCKNDDVDGTSKTWRLLAEGRGPANVEPLSPMRVGMRRLALPHGATYDDGYNVPVTIPGKVVVDGQTLYRGIGGSSAEWWGVHDDGNFLYWSTSDGMLDAPVLVVPATVHVGMRWETLGDDDTADYVFEVRSREETTTLWGEGVVWTIDMQGTAAGSRTISRRYHEGRGLVGIEPAEGAGKIQTGVAGLLPDRDLQAPTIDLADALPLEPVEGPGGTQLAIENLDPHAISAAVLDHNVYTNTTEVRAFLQGYATIPNPIGVGFARIPNDVDGASDCLEGSYSPMLEELVWGESADCPRRLEELTGGITTDALASHAVGVTVDGTGMGQSALDPLGRTYFAEHYPLSLPTDEATFWWEISGLRGPDGAHETLYRGRSHWALGLESGDPVWWGLPDRFLIPFLFVEPGITGSHVSLPREVDEQDPMPVTLYGEGGGIVQTTWDWVDGFGPWEIIGGATGPFSFRATSQGREVLSVTPDGVIDHVVASPGAVEVFRLGHVAVPSGHRVLGAIRIDGDELPAKGDHLAVFTADLWPMLDTFPETDVLAATKTYGWLTELADDPDPIESLPTKLLGMADATHDLVVCAPGMVDGGPPDDWTFGGEPATVRPALDDRCMILFREAGDYSDDYSARGTLPGVGTVHLGLTPQLEEPWDAPPEVEYRPVGLADGRVMTNAHVYDDNVVAQGFAPFLAELNTPNVTEDVAYSSGSEPRPDLGGGGAWWVRQHPDCHGASERCVFRFGADGVRVELPSVHPSLVGLVGGGGVLASSASDTYLVAQDGTTTLLDLDGAMSGGGFVGFDWGSWLAANADGTVCGNHGGAGLVLACKESDGTVHVGEALPFDTSDARGGLLPLPDGRFLISATGHGSYALDPGDASVTLLDTRTVTDVVWDPDGHLWGIDEVTREVLHYDGSTVEVLDLPLPATQVIATREVVWVDGWRMPR